MRLQKTMTSGSGMLTRFEIAILVAVLFFWSTNALSQEDSGVTLLDDSEIDNLLNRETDEGQKLLISTLRSAQETFQGILENIKTTEKQYNQLVSGAEKARLKVNQAELMEPVCREQQRAVYEARAATDGPLSPYGKRKLGEMQAVADKCFDGQEVIIFVVLKELGIVNVALAKMDGHEVYLEGDQRQLELQGENIRRIQSMLDIPTGETVRSLDSLREVTE